MNAIQKFAITGLPFLGSPGSTGSTRSKTRICLSPCSSSRSGTCWLSSRSKKLRIGSRSYSRIHVTGDRARKRAFLTEGPLKGDVASFLANDALFICTGGVNAIHWLLHAMLDESFPQQGFALTGCIVHICAICKPQMRHLEKILRICYNT